MPGSLRQRGPNTWQVRVSAGRDPATGQYRCGSRTVEGGKSVAQKAAAELARAVEVLRRQRVRATERAERAGVTLEAAAYVWSQALDSSSPTGPTG